MPHTVYRLCPLPPVYCSRKILPWPQIPSTHLTFQPLDHVENYATATSLFLNYFWQFIAKQKTPKASLLLRKWKVFFPFSVHFLLFVKEECFSLLFFLISCYLFIDVIYVFIHLIMSVFILFCFCLSLCGWKHTSINIRDTSNDSGKMLDEDLPICSCNIFILINWSIRKTEVGAVIKKGIYLIAEKSTWIKINRKGFNADYHDPKPDCLTSLSSQLNRDHIYSVDSVTCCKTNPLSSVTATLNTLHLQVIDLYFLQCSVRFPASPETVLRLHWYLYPSVVFILIYLE